MVWNSIDKLWSSADMHRSVNGQISLLPGDAFLTTGFHPPRSGPFVHPSAARHEPPPLLTSGFMQPSQLSPPKHPKHSNSQAFRESARKLSQRTPYVFREA